MSEQGKFINTYIDVMVGTIHEMMNSSLQLKTNMKISTDLLIEKDKQIGNLTAEIETINNNKLSFDATIESNNTEIDSLKSQLSLLVEKDKQISNLTAEIEAINNNKLSFDATIESNRTEIDSLKSQLSRNQQELESLRSKASHTDSLLQQIISMKQEIKNRDNTIAEKNKEIEAINNREIEARDKIIAEKDKEIETINNREIEAKAKKPKLSKISEPLKLQQINITEDNLLKYKDDF
jgi:chromosome segregation ATPase